MYIVSAKFKVVLSLIAAAQIVACSSGNKTNGDAAMMEGVNWSSCENAEPFECAVIQVPMNYAELEGDQIDIALTRLPNSSGNRTGSLLFNFGGFGGGGIEELQFRVLDGLIPEPISQDYDLVGFDPRGVGGSTAVDCSEQGAGGESTYPADASQVETLLATYEQVAADCLATYGDYLQHLGSINVVRDMEEIRLALGDEAMNFYSASAGTRYAALYLQEFPQTSGRFVLDASLRADSSQAGFFTSTLPGMQRALLDGLSLCSTSNPQCDETLLSDQLAERTKSLALENTDASMLELQVVEFVVSSTQETPELWPFVSEPLVSYIESSDVTFLLDLIGQFIDFDDPAELFSDEDPGLVVDRAVVCADDANRPDLASMLTMLDEFNQLSDYFAESSLAQAAMCAGWPEALEPLSPIGTNMAPISLVIGGTTDVLTPPEWSQEMAAQLGGVYLSSGHDGHTGLFDDKSPCLESVVAEFFIDGVIPAFNGEIPATDECDGN